MKYTYQIIAVFAIAAILIWYNNNYGFNAETRSEKQSNRFVENYSDEKAEASLVMASFTSKGYFKIPKSNAKTETRYSKSLKNSRSARSEKQSASINISPDSKTEKQSKSQQIQRTCPTPHNDDITSNQSEAISDPISESEKVFGVSTELEKVNDPINEAETIKVATNQAERVNIATNEAETNNPSNTKNNSISSKIEFVEPSFTENADTADHEFFSEDISPIEEAYPILKETEAILSKNDTTLLAENFSDLDAPLAVQDLNSGVLASNFAVEYINNSCNTNKEFSLHSLAEVAINSGDNEKYGGNLKFGGYYQNGVFIEIRNQENKITSKSRSYVISDQLFNGFSGKSKINASPRLVTANKDRHDFSAFSGIGENCYSPHAKRPNDLKNISVEKMGNRSLLISPDLAYQHDNQAVIECMYKALNDGNIMIQPEIQNIFIQGLSLR